MVRDTVGFVYEAVVGWLDCCRQIFVATGTADLWIAGVLFTVCVSVLVLPLRGGQSVTGNSLAGFLTNKVNSHRRSSKRSVHDD